MNEQSRRKELREQYKRSRPEAGVYRIVNGKNGKSLLGSTANLASLRSKMEFAKSTNTPGALDRRLAKDVAQFGLDAFSLEILDVLEIRPEMTAADVQEELATLEALWRERMDPSFLY
ncbi:MAG: GIY-YIG nuclease family protein [Chloroflexi bacterium]|nr:GIY-YIG nuclease family protein [Chloroflexota bacterium]MCL5109157.1 GIY-YIG nuclease family protein [Chloroflexota bacterium]